MAVAGVILAWAAIEVIAYWGWLISHPQRLAQRLPGPALAFGVGCNQFAQGGVAGRSCSGLGS